MPAKLIRRKNAEEYASEAQELHERMAEVLQSLRGLDSDLADDCATAACDALDWWTAEQHCDAIEEKLEEEGVLTGSLEVILGDLVEAYPDIDLQAIRCTLAVQGFPAAAQHVGDWDLAHIHFRRRKREGL